MSDVTEGEPAPPASRLRDVVRVVVGLAIGIGTAAIALHSSDVTWVKVKAAFASVEPAAIVACVVSSFIMLGFQSLRWYTVMKPLLGLPYREAYKAQLVGYMANGLLWGRAGDLLRVEYLGRRTGKSRGAILGTEVVDRWLDFWGWIPTMLLLALVSDLPSWIWKSVALFGGLLVAWAIAMIALNRRGYTPKPGSRFAPIFASFKSGIDAFATRRTLGIAFGLSPLSWLWEAFFIWRITPYFDIHLTFPQTFCVLIGFNLATAIPSPGNAGTEEAGGVTAFTFFGVDASRAAAFMFLYHLTQWAPGVLAGALVVLAERGSLVRKKRA